MSDPFNEYALPVKTVYRKNLKTDLAEIGSLVKEKMATAVVCGLPVNFDGTPSEQTKKALFFIEKLKENFGVEIYTVDERCTTCEAENTLINQGKSREERKKLVDSLAAASILDGFLREKNSKNKKQENVMNEENKNLEPVEEFEDEVVELTLDDGRKFSFYFIDTIEYKGKLYSAFQPAEEVEGLEEDSIVIFEVSGDDEQTADLLPVEDDALLDEVFAEFCRIFDEEEEIEG